MWTRYRAERVRDGGKGRMGEWVQKWSNGVVNGGLVDWWIGGLVDWLIG
jgi:hypothetical protein